MKTISFIKSIVFGLMVMVSVAACDNNDVTGIDTSIDPTLLEVALSTVDADGYVTVDIPLGVFGDDATALDGASIDLFLNGALVLSDLDPQDYFNDVDAVRFNVSPLSDGGTVGILVNTIEGSELYYEGTVSVDAEGTASIAVFSGNLSPVPTTGEIEALFDQMLSTSGDAAGTDMSGTYTVVYTNMTFSDDCTVNFVQTTDFNVSSDSTDAEIADEIYSGVDNFARSVTITQTDGVFVWDDLASTENDFAGSVNTDGSFLIFDGSFVDEANYTYMSLEGTYTAADGTFMASLYSTIILDGTRLTNGVVGSCSVSADLTGELSDSASTEE